MKRPCFLPPSIHSSRYIISQNENHIQLPFPLHPQWPLLSQIKTMAISKYSKGKLSQQAAQSSRESIVPLNLTILYVSAK